jgi:DNA-binding response OmpR family regulator
MRANVEASNVTTILVAADEAAFVASLRDLLEDQGFDVLTACSGEAVLDLARHFAVDLAILDVMLDGLDGFKTCQALRKESNAPIIMLTVAEDSGKVACLEMQADAISARPFGVRELPGRVGAILRRRNRFVVAPPVEPRGIIPRAAPILIGDLTIMLQERRVLRGDAIVPLTDHEFKVLAYLVANRGRDCLYPEMIAGIWQSGEHVTPHLISYFIAQLRKKLEADPTQPVHIRTVSRGDARGYRFEGA